MGVERERGWRCGERVGEGSHRSAAEKGNRTGEALFLLCSALNCRGWLWSYQEDLSEGGALDDHTFSLWLWFVQIGCF